MGPTVTALKLTGIELANSEPSPRPEMPWFVELGLWSVKPWSRITRTFGSAESKLEILHPISLRRSSLRETGQFSFLIYLG